MNLPSVEPTPHDTSTLFADVPPGSVVVGYDGSPCADAALTWAVEQAALEQRPLVLVHAIQPIGAQSMGAYGAGGLDYAGLLDDFRSDARSMLESGVAVAREQGPDLDVHHVLSVCDPRSALLDLSEKAAVVVLGSRGRGPIASLLLGSVSVSVSRHASCPVVIRHDNAATEPFHRILVGVEGTPYSLPSIEFAFRMASFRSSALTVVHGHWIAQPVAFSTVPAPLPDLGEERALVSESLAGMAEKFPEVEVEVLMVFGHIDHHLVTLSATHDLVAIGHHRVGPWSELLHDSVAASVLEHASGTVAVVPSPARVPDLPTGG